MGTKKRKTTEQTELFFALKNQVELRRHGRSDTEKKSENELKEHKQTHEKNNTEAKQCQVDATKDNEAIQKESHVVVPTESDNVQAISDLESVQDDDVREDIDKDIGIPTYLQNDQHAFQDKTAKRQEVEKVKVQPRKRKKETKNRTTDTEESECKMDEQEVTDVLMSLQEIGGTEAEDPHENNTGSVQSSRDKKKKKRKKKHRFLHFPENMNTTDNATEIGEIILEQSNDRTIDGQQIDQTTDVCISASENSQVNATRHKNKKKKKKVKRKNDTEQIDSYVLNNNGMIEREKEYVGNLHRTKMTWYERLKEVGKPLFEDETMDEVIDLTAKVKETKTYQLDDNMNTDPHLITIETNAPENTDFNNNLPEPADRRKKHGQLNVGKSNKTDCNRKEESEPTRKYIVIEEQHAADQTKTGDGQVDENSCEFSFTLSEEEWDQVKPEIKLYGPRQIQRRRLRGNWTNIFADHIRQVHHGCVLTKSRISVAPFVASRGVCKGEFCRGVFDMKILHEDSEKTVFCTVKGHIKHTEVEVNRRNVSSQNRQSMGERLKQSTPAVVFNDNLLDARIEEMEQGNFSTVPNPDVLRKMVSELVRKEYLHSNIMYELQLLKENDELIGSPYIREIGLDPFVIMMFSDEQLKLVQTLSATNSLDIYMDATGSVVKNIERQKRPFLYSLVVRLPEAEVPVSIGDMVTTQQTIPRISHFLNTIKRHVSLKGHALKIRKMESDFSYAIIQACLQILNCMTLKTYLQKCYQILQSKQELNLTVHHLCASHMIQDFSRTLKRKLTKNIQKTSRTFAMQCFAALQNSTSLQQGMDIFKQFCTVCLSRKKTKEVKTMTKNLQKLVENFMEDTEIESEETLEFEDVQELPIDTRKTIREVSPFTNIFEVVKVHVQAQIDATDDETADNLLYLPDLPDLLISTYFPLFPLWSGIMLAAMKNSTDEMTRDTNSPVENWFKYLKTNVTSSERDRRPAVFVMKNKAAIQARLRVESFPGARKKKTARKQKLDETDLNIKEESWTKGRKRKGNLYHKSPSKRVKVEKKATPVTDTILPRVMKWGGRVEDMNLTNTCTIDNGLTIIHVLYQKHEAFRDFLSAKKTETFNTLQTVMTLMNDGEFDQAKLVWARLTTSVSTNLFGDEVEFMMNHLQKHWKIKTVSRCLGPDCPKPIKESMESGFCVSINGPVTSMQELVDKWINCMVDCPYDRKSCGEVEDMHVDEQCYVNGNKSHGLRDLTRQVIEQSPILVVRIYEHVLHGRLTIYTILNGLNVCINDSMYTLAGVTMHRADHFCAIVVSESQNSRLWYDGLIGELRPLPDGLSTWCPCHAIYCQMS